MEVNYILSGGSLQVNLDGELDESSAGTVRGCLDEMIEKLKFEKMVLNMENLTFMDSTGVGVILGRYKKLKANNQKIFVINQSKHIDKVLKTTGIYSILNR